MAKNPKHDEAIELFRQGVSAGKAAKKLDVPPGTVRTWLYNFND